MSETMVFSLTVVAVLIILLGLLRLRHVSMQGLVFGLIGAIVGLLLGALISVPLSKLPAPIGSILPLALSIVLTVSSIALMLARRTALLEIMPFLDVKQKTSGSPEPARAAEPAEAMEAPAPSLPPILVDTSAIIDGRIADIATAGFMPGRLLVPRFVLAELQNIADSEDAMRRGRGRRGLDVLNTLRELPDVDVEIIEDDAVGIKEVDAKLVALAQKFHCNVLTTDYNLNRVAQIQGVRVLNVNELSNAIRPVVLPGERLIVRVVQAGKERGQGVGYLADGTMIVVDNGDKLIGQEVTTEVTRVFQTVAGKMIFAAPRGPGHASPSASVDTVTTIPGTEQPISSSSDTHSAPSAPADASAAANPARKRFSRNRSKQRSPQNIQPTDKPQQPRQGSPVSSQSDLESRIVAATSHPRPPKHP